MKNRITITLLTSLMLLGCGGGSDSTTTEGMRLPVYNQAYQENFKADSIEEILKNAKGAYVLVDPFSDNVVEYLAQIKAKGNQLGGYISAGTGEAWRSDFDELEPYLSEKVWDEWEGEYYVSQTTTGVVEVMKRRIDKMARWGIDWVEFDNMDWFNDENREKYQLELDETQAKAYINTLCAYTHKKGMKCMAKNTVEGFDDFDGVLYESTSENKNWWEREGTRDFLKAGKLVIINHYNESDCDGVYRDYQSYYDTNALSFICEDKQLKKYRHYN